jgi:cytochrome c oxidase cbb3-type subunit I/II
MYAGFLQASMWNSLILTEQTYGNFLETVTQIMPMYWMRAIGGTLYIIGMFVLNNVMLLSECKVEDELAEVMNYKN